MFPLKIINIFICESLQQVNDRICQIEESTFVKYVVYSMDKGFTEDWKPQSKNKVYWEWLKGKDTPCIPFDGVPFMFIGQKVMGCHRGREKDSTKKQRYIEARAKATKEEMEARKGKKGKRVHLIQTKKLSCPAKVAVTRIAKFNGFKLDTDRVREKKAKSMAIRHALLEDPASVEWKILYYVRVPNISDHVGHPIGKGADDVDGRVRDYIRSMVKRGVTRVQDMKVHMVKYVRTELFKDGAAPPHRKYFPTQRTIRDIMTQTRTEDNFTKIDLANLVSLSNSWKEEAPQTSYLFRTQSETQNLLLCYQTEWQRALLHLYGGEVFFLDSAHRRARLPLPLYLLGVRTNASVVAVGMFVVQSRSAEALKEALGVFRQWSPSWSPAYCLTEDCPVEMEAVEGAFSGSLAVYNDFLRERTWTQWLGNRARGVTDQAEVLEKMKAIAGALTKDDHRRALWHLQESSIWSQRPLFRNWFSKKWLTEEKRWVSVARAEQVNLVSVMNGGMQLQKDFFSHQELRVHKSSSLSHILRFLATDLFPQTLQRYSNLNSQSSREFFLNPKIPPFLWHRPRTVVSWMMDKMESAVQCLFSQVEAVGEGIFRVWSSSEDGESHMHLVRFGSESSLPSCGCDDWAGQRLPCEHFCQVFRLLPDWGWERLSPLYRDHPLLTLHTTQPSEVEGAVAELVDPASLDPCPDWDGPEVIVPSTPLVVSPATPQAQASSQVLLLTPATPVPPCPSAARVLDSTPAASDRDELQRECESRLESVMEDVRKIRDLEQLRELRQKLEVFQAQTHRIAAAQTAGSPHPAGGPVGKRKRAEVDIIIAMPKRVNVLSRIDDENVQK
ncbi:uncharacterized protein si:dkey-31c13.1 isoform X1 [Hypomesus transpacificus]|uniref:uncharacterized protein si:dkey-31c13.1 isoform X1 n=2 Tax=Hypomesus transpacificus TaxID=137520 RepID=UPI001F076F4A|nr:uncharacterized protein si:dkey-31c13.1 isoform X1 [Hypomesus transpacificus]